MSNKFENYSAEEFVKWCFADDSGKYKNEDGYRFWKNFANPELRIDVWEDGCPKIYNYAKSYDALPDPDVNSYDLYEAHIRVWNIQHKKFNIKNIKRNGRCRCEIITEDEQVILGSDSIMSIYWHRTYGNMRYLMKEIKDCIEISEKHSEFCQDVKETNYKKFIENYLQQANTIGGFMLFPRHDCSINQARGISDRIQDRFDLTLECIRRMYESGFPTSSNPLFDMSKEDKEYFEMFGSFENYAKFFCLNKSYGIKHNWVTEDCSAVYDLMSENGEDTLKATWPKEILPCDFKEKKKQVAKWWTFYRNIMNRLDARNEQIKNLINKK